jgi:DNA-binding NarL/FixJ family response regulator
MSSKEAIEKIKNMLFGEVAVQAPAPVPTPEGSGQVFAEYKLKDGTVVSIDKVEIGGQVNLNGEPAPDGYHLLEDGTKIEVLSGLIVGVEKEEVVADVPEEMKKLPVMMSAVNQDIVDLKKTIDAQAKLIATQSESLKQMFALVETIANNSIEQPKEAVKSFDEMSALEKFRAQRSN